MAKEKGFDIPEKSGRRYAKEDGNEYVFVRIFYVRIKAF